MFFLSHSLSLTLSNAYALPLVERVCFRILLESRLTCILGIPIYRAPGPAPAPSLATTSTAAHLHLPVLWASCAQIASDALSLGCQLLAHARQVTPALAGCLSLFSLFSSFAAATQDTADDDGESVKLGFGTMPAGVTEGTTKESVVSITDDDVPSVTVSYEQATYTVAEGSSVTVKVKLNVDPERTVTIPVTKAN